MTWLAVIVTVASFVLGSISIVSGAYELNNGLGFGSFCFIVCIVSTHYFNGKREEHLLSVQDKRHEKLLEEIYELRSRLR